MELRRPRQQCSPRSLSSATFESGTKSMGFDANDGEPSIWTARVGVTSDQVGLDRNRSRVHMGAEVILLDSHAISARE